MTASRFAKPVARVVLAAAGLVLLAAIGHFSTLATNTANAANAAAAAPVGLSTPAGAIGETPTVGLPPPSPSAASPPSSSAIATPVAAPVATSPRVGARVPASADDPVILNSATVDDLRRLPGIGDKRANAILALRSRIGRFRALEDLLKVKGIGRAMLRRLRPLVRLDPAIPPADGG